MKNITVTASIHPQHKEITLLAVKGFIDTNTAPEFDRTFQGALNEKKFKLVVDLKDVTYISSAGWGLFVGEIKRIRNQKGDLILAAMSPEVEEAYDLLQFSTILKAYPTVDQAVQKGFGKSPSAKSAAAAPLAKEPASVSQGAVASVSTMGVGREAPTPTRQLPKTSWLGKILMPWKWF
jgi:anti-sigma B factor antagonist